MQFSMLSTSNKIIAGATLLAIISLFLPWVDLGIFSASGFQQDGYLFLVLFIYPVYCVVKNRNVHKIGGVICGILGIIAIIAYINSKSTEIFGETLNPTGTGAYVFLISTILLTVAAFVGRK